MCGVSRVICGPCKVHVLCCTHGNVKCTAYYCTIFIVSTQYTCRIQPPQHIPPHSTHLSILDRCWFSLPSSRSPLLSPQAAPLSLWFSTVSWFGWRVSGTCPHQAVQLTTRSLQLTMLTVYTEPVHSSHTCSTRESAVPDPFCEALAGQL